MTRKHAATSRIRVWPALGGKKRVKVDPNKPTKKKASPKREPLLIAALASVVAWVALKFGIPIDDETANQIAGVIVAAALLWARSRVTPTADPVVPPSEDVAVADPAAGVRAINAAKDLT